MGSLYQVTGTGLSVSTTNDIVQLRGAAGVIIKIHEIRVWQTSETTLAMNGIRLIRGTGGATGTGLVEREFDIVGSAPAATAFSIPGTNVATGVDFDFEAGWNILQEFVYLPTPALRLHMAASDELGVRLINSDTLTMGVTILWEEIGV